MGRGGGSRGSARTPDGVDPRGQPVTNSWRVASVGVMRRFGSHLEQILLIRSELKPFSFQFFVFFF